MKYIVYFFLLSFFVSAFAFTNNNTDAKTLVVHGDTLWFINLTTNDSIQLTKTGAQTATWTNKTLSTGSTWSGNAIADAYISSSAAWSAKQAALSGTGFLKFSGTTPSYDNSTYLTSINLGNVTTALAYTPLNPANNLSEVTASSARTNLGLIIGTNVLAPNGSAASLTSFPTLNQNTSGTAADLSAVLSYAKGGISSAAATSATTGTMTVNMTSSVVTITPTGSCTFNASGGVAGQVLTFSITTSGVSSFTLTWGTNFRKTATLATGTTSARFFTVTFICVDGTIWSEVCRTAVQS